MANLTALTSNYANNLTVTTELSNCQSPVNTTSLLKDLFRLYHNNISSLVSSVFSNVSIPQIDCYTPGSMYFEQLITFTSAISIRLQVAVAAIYYDYTLNHSFLIPPFDIGQEGVFYLSSVTVNNTPQYDGCASGDAAQEPLCLKNSSTPVCYQVASNPWVINCSQYTTTSTTTFSSATTPLDQPSTTLAPGLNNLELGLICGIGALLFLILIGLIIYGIRRYLRVTRVVYLNENLTRGMKSVEKSGIPQGQVFQRAATVAPVKRAAHQPVLWIREGQKVGPSANAVNVKPTGFPRKGTFVDHAKIHDPAYPSRVSPTLTVSRPVSTETVRIFAPKMVSSMIVSRPVSGTSTNQLRSIIDRLEAHTLDESESISLDRSNATPSKKPSTPVSRQLITGSFVEESLHDEDAWMSILAVANAELDVLNRLENDQNRLQTLV